jgi:class 3 adenylate cyclase
MLAPQFEKGSSVPDQTPVERRLAAIVAADIVGFSRLMGADEVGTLAALKAIRRELVDPAIASHQGRVVKTTGDGLLIEFASAVARSCGQPLSNAEWQGATRKLRMLDESCSASESMSVTLLPKRATFSAMA